MKFLPFAEKINVVLNLPYYNNKLNLCSFARSIETRLTTSKSIPKASSETQGFKGDGKGREKLGAGKKGEGRGGEGKEERGSPGKLLYTDHFSIEEQTPLARCETEALV